MYHTSNRTGSICRYSTFSNFKSFPVGRSPRTPAEMPDLYPGSEENSNSDASVVPSIDSLALEGFNVLTDKVPTYLAYLFFRQL